MVPITGETREETWLKAINHLVKNAKDGLEYNLIMEVTRPSASNSRSKEIRKKFDTLLLQSPRLYSVNTVAETIFPATEYKLHGMKGVTEIYPNQIFPKIKSSRGNGRGTYAFRIVQGKNAKGQDCNPLKTVVNNLKGQLSRSNGIRCAFELSLDDVQSLPINRNDTCLQGFPCLSHLSFKLSHDRSQLHLTALYRSHDYVQKALGNLLGLARLQAAVARELEIDVGCLVCHSTIARLDKHPKIGQSKISNFLKEFMD